MERIKSLNGYTIYRVTERDAKRDERKTAGDYEIYFSSDIRDCGLAYSDAEFDGIGTLENALELCAGNYAKAREIAENESTAASFERIEEIEKQLDAGKDADEITETDETDDYTNAETFESYLNGVVWFDGELIINNIDSEFSFVWDSEYIFTDDARREYGAILNSKYFAVDSDNVITLTAVCNNLLSRKFLALCAGYVSNDYYEKCIVKKGGF